MVGGARVLLHVGDDDGAALAELLQVGAIIGVEMPADEARHAGQGPVPDDVEIGARSGRGRRRPPGSAPGCGPRFRRPRRPSRRVLQLAQALAEFDQGGLALLGALALGDVHRGAGKAQRRAVGGPHEAPARDHPAMGAVRLEDPVLAGEFLGTREEAVEFRLEARHVVGVEVADVLRQGRARAARSGSTV